MVTNLFYTKFWPEYSDNRGIHADDQFHDGTASVVRQLKSNEIDTGNIEVNQDGVTITPPLGPSVDEPYWAGVSNPDNIMSVIGNAIESYQGWKTVEVFKGCTLLYYERNIELLKWVSWDYGCFDTTEQIVFRMRSKRGSAYYKDYYYYARQVWVGFSG